MRALIYKLLDRRTRLLQRLILALSPGVLLVMAFSVLLFPRIGLKVTAVIFAVVGIYFFLRGLSGLIVEALFRIRLFVARRRNRIR